jgi:hypothetical protein
VTVLQQPVNVSGAMRHKRELRRLAKRSGSALAAVVLAGVLVVVMVKGYVVHLAWNSLRLELAPAASITGREAR